MSKHDKKKDKMDEIVTAEIHDIPDSLKRKEAHDKSRTADASRKDPRSSRKDPRSSKSRGEKEKPENLPCAIPISRADM